MPNNARGLFQFTGRYTGNALGDFLLGAPNQGQVGLGGRGALLGRTNWIHTYIEDGWQITPSLKLDIGLRYEYNQNVTDVNNNMAIVNTLVPGGQFVIASNSQGQISPAATAYLSNIPIPFTSPRRRPAGIAACFRDVPCGWLRGSGLPGALPDHKTVIRSGFGIYTNQAAYSIIQNAALNLPFYFAKNGDRSRRVQSAVHYGKYSVALRRARSARITSITISRSNTTMSGICPSSAVSPLPHHSRRSILDRTRCMPTT